MSLPFFIARRLYSTNDKSERISKLGVNIATTGIAVGLIVMIVSVAGVLGFKGEIKNKVIGFGSHIQMVNADAMQQADTLPLIASTGIVERMQACEGVKHVQRITRKTGILKTDTDFQGITFTGIGNDYDSTFLCAHLVEGTLPDYTQDSCRNDIVISRSIAETLQLNRGDKVFAYFFGSDIRMRRYKVSAIYETNMMQFDNATVFTSRTALNALNGWDSLSCSALEITVSDFDRSEDVADMISTLKPQYPDRNGCFYAVYTVRELYGAIFDWLKLLDLNIWVILGLMVCVCCFTMISGLLILILERTQTIGILKALGAGNTTMRRVFQHYGVMIIWRGLLVGNLVGLLLCWVQSQWHIARLDSASYYVDHVPITFNWLAILALNAATLIICALVLVGPTLIVSHIKPVKALKFD